MQRKNIIALGSVQLANRRVLLNAQKRMPPLKKEKDVLSASFIGIEK